MATQKKFDAVKSLVGSLDAQPSTFSPSPHAVDLERGDDPKPKTKPRKKPKAKKKKAVFKRVAMSLNDQTLLDIKKHIHNIAIEHEETVNQSELVRLAIATFQPGSPKVVEILKGMRANDQRRK